MSRLAKAIDATLTGNIKAGQRPKFNYTDIRFDINPNPTPTLYANDKEVGLTVKLQTRAWIHEHEWENIDARSSAIRDLKRAMIEEMFGEFRPIILELRASMYDRDDVRTRSLLAELENQMFADGI